MEPENLTLEVLKQIALWSGPLITVIKDDRDFRGRVERVEKDVAALKQRLPDA